MTEVEAIIKELEDQRNQAFIRAVNLRVQVAQLETRVEQLVAEIAERDKPIEEPAAPTDAVEAETAEIPK